MTDSSLQKTPQVFISYRWEDTPHNAKDLARLLALRFGADQIFFDQNNMFPGHHFPSFLDHSAHACRVLIVVIGPKWLSLLASHTDPGQDYVRFEINTAFANKIAVIPFYTGGQSLLTAANLPQDLVPLTEHLAIEFTSWQESEPKLVETVRKQLSLPTGEKPSWRCPELAGECIERPELLDLIDATLTAGRSVILYGPPGIGKSEAAIRYAQQRQNATAERFQSVFWVSVEHEDRLEQVLRTILAQLGDRLSQEQPITDVKDAFKRRFENEENWLLVLDNVEKKKILQDFFDGWEAGHLLMTSRDGNGYAPADPIEVSPLTQDEGAILLLRRARRLRHDKALADGTEADQHYAREISHRVEGLPLALDQAGGYIGSTLGCSPEDYLKLYDNELGKLLLEDPAAQKERQNVWITFTLAFNSLKTMLALGPLAINLLQMCAFFAPEGIPADLLAKGGSAVGGRLGKALASSVERNALIRVAASLSLLKMDGNTAHLRMHRLIRDILRVSMSVKKQEEWARRAVIAVDISMPDPSEDATAFQWYWPHAETALNLIDKFSLPTRDKLDDVYSLADFAADLRVQHALRDGDSWEQLFGVDNVQYADLANRTLHQLENKKTGRRLRRIIASLHRTLPEPLARRRVFACLYFVAHYWWDRYLSDDNICPPLLDMWEHSTTLTEQSDEDRKFVLELRTFEACYPPGRAYQQRTTEQKVWEQLEGILLNIQSLLGFNDQPKEDLYPGGRYVFAITNLYLAEARQYASNSPNEIIWDLYKDATDLLQQNGDAFHVNWSHSDHAEALRVAGKFSEAWAQCRQALIGIVEAEEQCEKEDADAEDEEAQSEDEFDSELVAVTYRVMADIQWETPEMRSQAWSYYAAAALAALAFVLSEGDAYAFALYTEMQDRLTEKLDEEDRSGTRQGEASQYLAGFWADYWAQFEPAAHALLPALSHSEIKPPKEGKLPSLARQRIAHTIAAMPLRQKALQTSWPLYSAPEYFDSVLDALSRIKA